MAAETDDTQHQPHQIQGIERSVVCPAAGFDDPVGDAHQDAALLQGIGQYERAQDHPECFCGERAIGYIDGDNVKNVISEGE